MIHFPQHMSLHKGVPVCSPSGTDELLLDNYRESSQTSSGFPYGNVHLLFRVGNIAVPDMATMVVSSFFFNASRPALNAAGYEAEAEPARWHIAWCKALSIRASV